MLLEENVQNCHNALSGCQVIAMLIWVTRVFCGVARSLSVIGVQGGC